MTGSRYIARYRGEDFECAIARDLVFAHVLLFSDTPRDGFERVTESRYLLAIAGSECEQIDLRRTSVRWRDQPCVVLDEGGSQVEIEYSGGDFAAAEGAGFTQIERGVFRATVSSDELSDRLEESLPVV